MILRKLFGRLTPRPSRRPVEIGRRQSRIGSLSRPADGLSREAGTEFLFLVTGHAPGSVWGDAVYTDDSALGVVAVHAGPLRRGQKGLIKVTLLPGRGSYEGVERNGVASQPYAIWQGSYRVEAAPF